MEINQNFEVIIPGRTVHNKIISNIKIFLENSIKVTFIANQNNLEEKYDNLEIKIIKENNISKKRNIGIENSTAEYLIFIDTDIVPNGKYLESLNLNLKKNYDVLSGPNIHTHNESLINNLIADSYKCIFIQGFNNFFKKKFKGPIVAEFAQSCNLIIKRKILIDNNIKFNEKLFTGEDLDFCRKLRKINVKINFDGDLWVHHKTKNLKNFFFERIIYGKSFFNLIKNKLYNFPVSIILLIFYFFLNFIFILFVFHHDLNKFYILFILIPFMLDALINVSFKKFLIQGIFNIFFSFSPLIGILFGKIIDNSNYKNDADIEK